jgi:protein-S-isoprenylcysteine O-methyltransferase Ste14
VTAALGLAAWLATPVVPMASFPQAVPWFVGAVVGLAGGMLELAGAVRLVRAETTVNPLDPTKVCRLVTGGVYRYTRNPIYVGDALILLGWALYLSNALAFASVPLFILYMDRFQIAPEERALDAAFGAEFADYRARVRRWI